MTNPDDNGTVRRHHPLRSNAHANNVESVVKNGREYLVFPIMAAREMVLNYPENGTKEFLPKEHLEESVPFWAGKKLTYVHPQNAHKTADEPEAYTNKVIGEVHEPEMVGDKLKVNGWLDVEKAEAIGGLAQEVVDQLRANSELGTSTGYATVNDQDETGTYDGEHYDMVQGNLLPDHVAVFPNSEFRARCSPEDGCAANRANADSEHAYPCSPGPCQCGCHVQRVNTRDSARTPEYDGTTTAEWEPPTFSEYVAEYYERQGAEPPEEPTVEMVEQDAISFAVERTLLGSVDADAADDVVSYPVVNLDDELNANALRSARALAGHQTEETAESIRKTTNHLLSKEFGDSKSNAMTDPDAGGSDADGASASGADASQDPDVDDDQAAWLGRRILNSLTLDGDAVQTDEQTTETTDPDDSTTSDGESTADSSSDPEPDDTDSGSADDTNMSNDNDISVEDLAERTPFTVDTLNGFDEEHLEQIQDDLDDEEQTTNTNDGDAGGDEPADDPADDVQTTNSLPDDVVTKDDLSDFEEKLNSIAETVEEQQNQEKRQTARAVANAIDGMSEDAAMELPEDQLDSLHDEHVEPDTKVNYGAVPGQMDRDLDEGDEDVSDWPAGGRTNYEQRKQGE